MLALAELRIVVNPSRNQLVSHVGIVPLQVERVHVARHESVERLVRCLLGAGAGGKLQEGSHVFAILSLHIRPDAFLLQVRQVAERGASTLGSDLFLPP